MVLDNCNVDVEIRYVQIKRTYEGLLLGRPNEEMNAEIIEELRIKFFKERWAKVYVPTPTTTVEEDGVVRLPCSVIMAELRTWEITEHFEGRELSVILFTDKNAFKEPLEKIILEQIHDIDWYKHSIPWTI